MAARKSSFASLVRAILAENGRMTTLEIRDEVIRRADEDMIAGRKVRPMVQHALKDLLKAGEVLRADVSTYVWAGKKEPVQIRAKMWSILRSRRVVSIEDLMELTGSSRGYALQWTRTLARHEIVTVQEDGRFRLVKDTVEQPDNEAKAAQLRQLRRRQALEKLRLDLENIGLELENMGQTITDMAEACETLKAEL
ncbi:MAG: hypothetical protein EOM10_00315 [Opitutae bacterium]|nr:hypothetical protein [Opitutae bacterium]